MISGCEPLSVKQIIIKSAAPRSEILTYFESQRYASPSEGEFQKDSVRILVLDSDHTQSSPFGIHHVPIKIVGPTSQITEIRDKFRLHFLRAGG